MLQPRHVLVAVLALIACGGTGYSIYLARELAASRAQLADSRSGAGELQKKLFAAEKRATEAAEAHVAATGTPATPAGAPVEAGGAPTVVQAGFNRGNEQRNAMQARAANFMAEMMADPELGPMMMAQRKRQLDQRYAGLFRQLNLPPEQLEKLKTLLAEKGLQRNEAQALARSEGLRGDDLRATVQQADADSDAQIKSLLGDKNYEALGVYEKTGGQRNAVSDFANRLSYTNPLTTAQSDQMVSILAANPLPGMNGRNFGGGGDGNRFAFAGGGGMGGGEILGAVMGGMGRNTSDDDIAAYVETKAIRDAEVLKQASTVLNAAQLQALQQQQQEENNQIHLMTVMRQKAKAAFPEIEQQRNNRQNRRGGPGGG